MRGFTRGHGDTEKTFLVKDFNNVDGMSLGGHD